MLAKIRSVTLMESRGRIEKIRGREHASGKRGGSVASAAGGRNWVESNGRNVIMNIVHVRVEDGRQRKRKKHTIQEAMQRKQRSDTKRTINASRLLACMKPSKPTSLRRTRPRGKAPLPHKRLINRIGIRDIVRAPTMQGHIRRRRR